MLTVLSYCSFGQGTESFSNSNVGTVNAYTNFSWTGDNGLSWSVTNARSDEGSGSSVATGMNGDYIIYRDLTGILTCNNIPNGCGTISFKYARAFAGSPSVALFINGMQYGITTSSTNTAAAVFSTIVNVAGTFKLEIRQMSSGTGSRIAIDDIAWTSFNATPCAEPTEQPTGLVLNTTPTSVTGSFTTIPSPTTVENYLVVRSTSATLSALPVDGTSYTVGQVIGGGNGTVVAVGSDPAFTDNVSPSTQYYYFVFAMNDVDCGGAPNYNQVAPLTGTATTPALPTCTTPASAPTALNLTAANTSISGSFTAAANTNRYLTVISTTATLSASLVDGTTYTVGQAFGGGTVVAFGTATTFSISGLTANTPYYIFVFAANAECTGAPFYNATALSGTITTTNNSTGIPVGFYTAADGQTCQTLKTTLKNIASANYTQLTYTPGVWQAYQFTDIRRNDANTADIIWDIYSDNPTGPEPYTFTYQTNQCGTYTGEGSCYNREHSTPKSWFADAYPMYTDVHHLYPTDGYVNNVRNNFPYGEVTNIARQSLNGSKLGTGTNFGYSGTVFEPINEYKGDVARTSLYMATRYEDEIIANNWSANGTANALFLSPSDEPDAAKRRLQIYDAWYLQTVFKWIGQDPVSQKEIDRNNAIYYQSGQGNRNPYVDHPEYAAMVFQCTGVLPVTITEFTGAKYNESVLLKWFATYETSFRSFEIERSTDAISFNKIGEVNGRNLANYTFNDRNLPKGSIVYYRLKMIDIDGNFKYSSIVSIKLDNNFSNALIYPNPTADHLNVKLLDALTENSVLTILDISGRNLQQQQVAKGQLNIPVDVKNLPSGRYFIKISNNGTVINQSFVVIK
ncbi:MAG: T9SS type A sorting domain-containing protein [Sphingobacteriales bacterium]|nr:MAG: T9SS type A sorting domain-containing protein [Sphingobacteriales bacterium]